MLNNFMLLSGITLVSCEDGALGATFAFSHLEGTMIIGD